MVMKAWKQRPYVIHNLCRLVKILASQAPIRVSILSRIYFLLFTTTGSNRVVSWDGSWIPSDMGNIVYYSDKQRWRHGTAVVCFDTTYHKYSLYCFVSTPLLLKLEYFVRTRSIQWLLMPGLLACEMIGILPDQIRDALNRPYPAISGNRIFVHVST